jgi:acylpyruvate hydrolase
MRLATIRTASGTEAVRVEGALGVLLGFADVGELMASGPDWPERARRASGPTVELASASRAPVVVRPSKILCLGLNYADHIAETGRAKPTHPTLFAKFPDTLTGDGDPIVLPRASACVDWEVELCAVVGWPIRHASEEEAAAAVGALTVANDVSMRDWQHRTTQFLQGKLFEATTPVGPEAVTLDEAPLEVPRRLRCIVDDEVMQDAKTDAMLFGVAETLAYLSQAITLRPGDLLLTGTPSGVGDGRDPKVFLQPGQVLRTEIEGIGALVNPVVADVDR